MPVYNPKDDAASALTGSLYIGTDFKKLWDAAIAESSFLPSIERVIFNPPATIVFWRDPTDVSGHSKTIVKCAEGEKFDPEKGLAMAIAKKALGFRYKQEFKEVGRFIDESSKYIAR